MDQGKNNYKEDSVLICHNCHITELSPHFLKGVLLEGENFCCIRFKLILVLIFKVLCQNVCQREKT